MATAISAGLARPNLDGVLAATAPGRILRLRLTGEQRLALCDSDGQLGLLSSAPVEERPAPT